jgi:hypothetical protein
MKKKERQIKNQQEIKSKRRKEEGIEQTRRMKRNKINKCLLH